jgi:hypothetical protein
MEAVISKTEELINEKVEMLYDFCILRHRKKKPDAREDAVRELLTECGTESRMQNVLHDVLLERITLTELLQRKGLM